MTDTRIEDLQNEFESHRNKLKLYFFIGLLIISNFSIIYFLTELYKYYKTLTSKPKNLEALSFQAFIYIVLIISIFLFLFSVKSILSIERKNQENIDNLISHNSNLTEAFNIQIKADDFDRVMSILFQNNTIFLSFLEKLKRQILDYHAIETTIKEIEKTIEVNKNFTKILILKSQKKRIHSDLNMFINKIFEDYKVDSVDSKKIVEIISNNLAQHVVNFNQIDEEFKSFIDLSEELRSNIYNILLEKCYDENLKEDFKEYFKLIELHHKYNDQLRLIEKYTENDKIQHLSSVIKERIKYVKKNINNHKDQFEKDIESIIKKIEEYEFYKQNIETIFPLNENISEERLNKLTNKNTPESVSKSYQEILNVSLRITETLDKKFTEMECLFKSELDIFKILDKYLFQEKQNLSTKKSSLFQKQSSYEENEMKVSLDSLKSIEEKNFDSSKKEDEYINKINN